MRSIVAIAVLVLLAGCAGEYSKVPEPVGEWVPANPPSLTAETVAPQSVAPGRTWHRAAPVRPVPASTVAAR